MNAQGTRTRYLLAVVAIATLSLGALSCGSSKSEDTTPKTDPSISARADTGTTEADLKAAASAATNANLADTPDSYAYLSADCKGKFSASEWATNMHAINQGLAAAAPAIATAKAGTVNVRSVTPDSGEAQVIIVDSSGKDLLGADRAAWSSWIVEDGQWVTEDCKEVKDLLAGD